MVNTYDFCTARDNTTGGCYALFLLAMNVLSSMSNILHEMKNSGNSHFIVSQSDVSYYTGTDHSKQYLEWRMSRTMEEADRRIQEVTNKVDRWLDDFTSLIPREVSPTVAVNFYEKTYSKIYSNLIEVRKEDCGQFYNTRKLQDVLGIVEFSKRLQLNTNPRLRIFIRDLKREFFDFKTSLISLIYGGVYATRLPIEERNVGHIIVDIVRPDIAGKIVAVLIPFHNLRNLSRIMTGILDDGF